MSIILDESTRVLVQGITGGEARRFLPTMKQYGTKIVAGTTPGKGGQHIDGIPVYNTIQECLQTHEIDLSVLFVPARFVKQAAFEAIQAGIKTIHILAEGVPHHDSSQIITLAKEGNVQIIGPNSQGMISPGKAKIGATGGETPELMFTQGPLGVISRSGGMGTEVCLFLTAEGIGQSTYVAIGGDLLIGSAFVDILELFQKDDETKCVFIFGEPGTGREEAVADFILSGNFTKPVIAMIPGDNLENSATPSTFGHTGAIIERGIGVPSIKKEKLKKAGVYIAESFSEIVPLVKKVLEEI